MTLLGAKRGVALAVPHLASSVSDLVQHLTQIDGGLLNQPGRDQFHEWPAGRATTVNSQWLVGEASKDFPMVVGDLHGPTVPYRKAEASLPTSLIRGQSGGDPPQATFSVM